MIWISKSRTPHLIESELEFSSTLEKNKISLFTQKCIFSNFFFFNIKKIIVPVFSMQKISTVPFDLCFVNRSYIYNHLPTRKREMSETLIIPEFIDCFHIDEFRCDRFASLRFNPTGNSTTKRESQVDSNLKERKDDILK